jgi:hypothetical protein
MKPARNAGMLLGTVAVGAATVLLGVALTRALVSSPVEDAPVVPAAGEPLAAEPTRPEVVPTPLVTAEHVQLAAEMAPFEPDRQGDGQRYRLPGERIEVVRERPPEREPEPAPDFEVLGTAASATGGVVVIRVEDGTPQLLTLGDQLEGYRVSSIESGRVAMTNEDRTLSLLVPSPSPTASQSRDRRGDDDDDDDDDRNQRNRNTQNERAARVQQPLQEMIQRFGAGQVRVEGERVFFSTPTGQQVEIPIGAARQAITPAVVERLRRVEAERASGQ